jgi:hypothetical protein
MTNSYPLICLAAVGFAGAAFAAGARSVQVRVNLAEPVGPMDIGRVALGQGGLSSDPIWPERMPEIRALHPKVIRLFLQEYFDVMPAPGKYHWTTMDESVDLIRKTGASPLMCIAFKPKALFPAIDQRVVDPSSYEQWEKLISEMVRHYKQRNSGIRYWEIANEPDIGENGGCPYLFTPESYVRYYRRTAAAILRADPEARVGGPALANSRSPLLPALLDSADRDKTPLHFVSWHIYNSDPQRIRETIDRTRALIAQHPALHPETFLDEWNMSLRQPVLDPRFQPCFVLETAYQMKEGGLDYSCYYHIRDYHVDPEVFGRFMSPQGNAAMARWWNRAGQFDGLFDYQNRVRPAYFAFKLLSRLTGDRVRLTGGDQSAHGLATRDERLGTDNILLWNFSEEPAHVDLVIEGGPSAWTLRRLDLNAAAPSDDENARLAPGPTQQATSEPVKMAIEIEPYGVTFLWGEKRR